jgi:hypothetical protein
VSLPVTLTSPKGGKFAALLTLDVIDTAITVIVGLPDLCLHFAQLVQELLLSLGQRLSSRLEGLHAITEDATLPAPPIPGSLHPAWVTPYVPPPEEEDPGLQPSIFPEVPAHAERLAAFRSLVPQRIFTDDPKLKADLQDILLRPAYAEIFAWKRWKFISGVPAIRLNWRAGMPSHNPASPRPCAVQKQDAAAHSINRFVEQGFWVPAGISPRYATPVVLVWKPDRSIRVCADYTSFVNKWLAPFEAPAPLIVQELERLSRYHTFINIDIKDAFYTLGLHPDDSEKLVVATHLGYFRPLSVPMGVTVGSALLQLVAQLVFAPLRDRAVILQDNVIVGLLPTDDPRAILTQLLDLCVKHDVTLAINKCEFVTSRTMFWGYLLERGKFSIDPIRRQGVEAIPIPRSLKHAQRFCGLANFFAGFIPHYREKAECVLAMLKPKYPFDAHSEHTIAAFDALKTDMINCQDLYMARRDLGPWILRCDASNIGAAAVLLQRCPLSDTGAIGSTAQEEDGFQLQPIALVSVPLSESARAKWPTHTAELYAIVQGCKKLESMLDGHPLIIETDHSNLLYAQSHHAALTLRWLMYLQATFNIVAIMHRPGLRNVLADTLSRIYSITSAEAAHVLDRYPSALLAVQSLAQSKRPPPVVESMANHLDALCSFSALPSLFVSDEPRGEAFALEQHAGELHPQQPNPAPPAPSAERAVSVEDAFAAAHNARSGHLGWRRTLLAMQARYPSLAIPHLKVKDLVDNCPTCSKYRNQGTTDSREVLHSLPMPTAPGYISADCFKLPEDHNGNTHVLVLINHSTKMVDLHAMRSKESKEVVQALYSHFCREGVPGMVLTDPGAEIHNNDVDSLLRWLQIKHGLSLVKRPQGHGTERTIGRVKQYLAILVGAENALARWSDRTILPAAQLFLNASFNMEIGAIPMHLRYGTVQFERFKRLTDEDLPTVETPELLRDIDSQFKAMQARADKVQAHMKLQRVGKGASPSERHLYQKGDFVFWRSDAILRPQGSLTSWLLGPYEVINQEGNTVRVQHLSSGKESTVHHDRLTPCTTNRELAIELARQDFPDQHRVREIASHKGDLLQKSSLSFEVIYEDGERIWKSYAEVNRTSALAQYAQRFQCTNILLAEDADTVKRRYATLDIPNLLDRGSSFEGHCLPRMNEIFYVTIHAFARSEALEQFTLPDDNEYVLQASVVQVSKKRIDLTFQNLEGLKVSWALHTFVAFCYPLIRGSQRHLDAQVMDAFPGLAIALGAHKPPKPVDIARRTATQQAAAEVEQWEAKLLDGKWHPIIIQQRFAKRVLAYCADIDEEVDVPLTRVRRAATISTYNQGI